MKILVSEEGLPNPFADSVTAAPRARYRKGLSRAALAQEATARAFHRCAASPAFRFTASLGLLSSSAVEADLVGRTQERRSLALQEYSSSM